MSSLDLLACAVVGSEVFTDLLELSSDISVLDGGGFWVVQIPYEGEPVLARFGKREPFVPEQWSRDAKVLSYRSDWESSLSQAEHATSVDVIRDAIAAGDVYQVNLCRVLSREIERPFDLRTLAVRVSQRHASPYFAFLQIPEASVYTLSASPECFLTRFGDQLTSRPIKGTTSSGGEFLDKDVAENLMIVDLVRNDLGRVCEAGSIDVPQLLERESYPGLDHLVSSVTGRLKSNATWQEILAATFRPGSVTGAPKQAACELITKLEPVSRGPYCGAIGWIDADSNRAQLGVAIRTFWVERERLCYGSGGAITWDSEPTGEWDETVLKTSLLLSLCDGL